MLPDRERIDTAALRDVIRTTNVAYLERFIDDDARTLRVIGADVAEALNLPARVVPYVDGYHLAMDDLDDVVRSLRNLGYQPPRGEADPEADTITLRW